jgi:hypothetical protein
MVIFDKCRYDECRFKFDVSFSPYANEGGKIVKREMVFDAMGDPLTYSNVYIPYRVTCYTNSLLLSLLRYVKGEGKTYHLTKFPSSGHPVVLRFDVSEFELKHYFPEETEDSISSHMGREIPFVRKELLGDEVVGFYDSIEMTGDIIDSIFFVKDKIYS